MSGVPSPGNSTPPRTMEKLLCEQGPWQLYQNSHLKFAREIRSGGGEPDPQVLTEGAQTFSLVENKKLSEAPKRAINGQDEDGRVHDGGVADLENWKRLNGEKRGCKRVKMEAWEVDAAASGNQNLSTRKKNPATKKSKIGSVESLFRRPGQTKSGSKKKAIAKPDGVDAVEDCLGGDVLITVPTTLFKLDSLSSILNLRTWHELLTEEERDFLKQFLPKSMDDAPHGELDILLQGKKSINFVNPVATAWDLLVEGEYHPRVVKYREGLRCLYHTEHFHSVRDYHNRMVLQLHDMARILNEESGTLPSKLKMCRNISFRQPRITAGGPHPDSRKKQKSSLSVQH